ncbi:hypothetical protein FRC00_005926 [Tulasnella sp. 408]|nr:hypothetical protein FRC00_005926 [Tulasnella sp. 408]
MCVAQLTITHPSSIRFNLFSGRATRSLRPPQTTAVRAYSQDLKGMAVGQTRRAPGPWCLRACAVVLAGEPISGAIIVFLPRVQHPTFHTPPTRQQGRDLHIVLPLGIVILRVTFVLFTIGILPLFFPNERKLRFGKLDPRYVRQVNPQQCRADGELDLLSVFDSTILDWVVGTLKTKILQLSEQTLLQLARAGS